MLSYTDRKWITSKIQTLIPKCGDVLVAGKLYFTAKYDNIRDLFTIISYTETYSSDDTILSGCFDIEITNHPDKNHLPLLYLKKTRFIQTAERHFNNNKNSINSACVCSPYESREFIKNGFIFQKYLEEYVVPFCYGQLYYNKKKKWPWSELAHYESGILEDYLRYNNYTIKDCLSDLRMQSSDDLFQKEPEEAEKMKCFCKSNLEMKSCHPEAYLGFIKLKKDLVYN